MCSFCVYLQKEKGFWNLTILCQGLPNILEGNIASQRDLDYIHFQGKCTVKEENILSAYLGFQANMDGDEGELVRFEKFKFYFRFVKQELR